MPKKTYVVDLTEDERAQLLDLIRAGETSARKIRRAHTLLLADEGKSDATIASVLHIGASTVQRTRQRFVEGNLERALNESPRPGQRPKLDDKAVMVLVTIARSKPPEGRKCWTMQLLAERLVELKVVDCISDETVRRVLKKTRVAKLTGQGGKREYSSEKLWWRNGSCRARRDALKLHVLK